MGGAKSKARVEPVHLSAEGDGDSVLAELQQQLAESRERERAMESQAKAARTMTQISGLAQQNHYSATITAQELFISKLEVELESTRQEVAQVRAKCVKTVQKVRVSAARSQAESALTVFELKDENNKLIQENARLLEQVRLERESSAYQADSPSHTSEGHLQLVLELSQQVSSMDMDLKQAQLTISKLHSQRRVDSAMSSKHSLFRHPSDEA